MEGPAFSTVAESNVYRSWGMDIIGMTNLQEAKLAREAEICYATVALVTDYDCWHPDHDAVTVDQVIAVLNQNSENGQKLIRAAVRVMDDQRPCKCGSALKSAILTDKAKVPAEIKEKLALLIGKFRWWRLSSPTWTGGLQWGLSVPIALTQIPFLRGEEHLTGDSFHTMSILVVGSGALIP
jgi:hypothetical protein